MKDAHEMLEAGRQRLEVFCIVNGLDVPELKMVHFSDWPFKECAYYRPRYIKMCLAKTSRIGNGIRSWSYPGYISDRTPFGVIAHELGHHVDYTFSDRKRSYFGNFSSDLRTLTAEKPITSYAPNDAEWFAEIFRLFVTNPSLLQILRPATFAVLAAKFVPVETRDWDDVLAGAPPRILEMAQRKVAAA